MQTDKNCVRVVFVGDKGSGKNYLLETYATREGGAEEEKAVGIFLKCKVKRQMK